MDVYDDKADYTMMLDELFGLNVYGGIRMDPRNPYRQCAFVWKGGVEI